ncbi:type I-E CRISPR-associated protein Cse1/CasA [Streptomyces sp. NPDC057686]|uniref:type I-E CRISPR-associated protein Cse1/CasA n=1 Tax=Streptomyces sp. NPDC057686 TaxID=3346212 RepID=UPI0036C98098
MTPADAEDVTLVKGVPGFDLVSRPWLPVQLCNGSAATLSLREVFARAGDIRWLVGDLPTQELALIRLLLAILHDAVDGPEDIDAWRELSQSPQPMAAVGPYLERHRKRFDLLHPTQPFFQVADLKTPKNEVASLNRIVADVSNGDPFFTMRWSGVNQLSFAEAARWLVHTQAFDTSGIKSGALGDPRVKSGKVYPQGVASAGSIGGVFAEGNDLQQTLLLNLVASDTTALVIDEDDRPAWCRDQCHSAVQADLGARPSGPRDLYTWQSRRIRLHHDGRGVYGVVLAYGDPLAASDAHWCEPMSGWRRSDAQEKRLGRPLVYMPRQHDPSRAAWRSIASLLALTPEKSTRRGGSTPYLRAGVLKWIAELAHERLLPPGLLIRLRLIGAVYGTQQSVFREVVDDGFVMPVVLLHERDQRYAVEAIGAVGDSNKAITALGDYAADLTKAARRSAEGPCDDARDRGFTLLDGPYRHWLACLGRSEDPVEARARWQRTVYEIVRDAAVGLPASACDTGWLDQAGSERIFHARLSSALPLRHAADNGSATATAREEHDLIKEAVQ